MRGGDRFGEAGTWRQMGACYDGGAVRHCVGVRICGAGSLLVSFLVFSGHIVKTCKIGVKKPNTKFSVLVKHLQDSAQNFQ